MSMQVGLNAVYDCIQQFSETDFNADLEKIDVPTLVIHGDDDQVVPIDAAGRLSAKIVKDAELKVCAGGPHGLFLTHRDQFNADLLGFVKS
jgi:non-heme chloroperoxidase